jgi:hypothetical protein
MRVPLFLALGFIFNNLVGETMNKTDIQEAENIIVRELKEIQKKSVRIDEKR